MKNRVNPYLAAATLALAPSLAGCASPADISQQSDAKDVARNLNKKPKHIVQLGGRVPDSLQIELVALYVTDTKDMTCFSHPGAKWGQGPNYHSEPIELARKNSRYSAALVVDKYLPGACNWTLVRVNAVVEKIGGPDEEAEVVEQVIHTYYFYHDESDSSGCDVNPRSGDHRKCPIEENSLNTPVVIPCKVASYASNAQPSFDCPALTKANYKVSHRVKPGQKLIQIDFYDLDKEPDPTE
ncbi:MULTISPECIES: hypothetical protein [unclassified Lysobacter]|uniref:hypothetical protein n=1 Tax=unclassified Lysobacter TaxID=2635362 RepID=UPI001BE83542|nr:MULTISPECIES: hypothetical protein [unclassified Lysobacter]MBT2748599.1 hypothetical protein [Lysobacter sp. ISL-42]MBT2751534.1 hypothetical protein [Lysobacter sp. ISL-50]MBT2775728.1 hypothetical protein [Lysobacter sp. ISL-54]MBT2782307.1 hypothetical protein [Lysobacter sp. ISL-52]